jgi:hypothetical protein
MIVQYDYAHRPELYALTSQGRQAAAATQNKLDVFDDKKSEASATNRPSTTHWVSTYKGAVEESMAKPINRSSRPEWSLPRQAYSSQRTFFVTENMRSYGTYGSKPQDAINPNSNKQENQFHELT